MKRHRTPVLALALAVLVVASSCGGGKSLRRTNWLDMSLPASICGGEGTIQLANGEALIHSTHWPDWPLVEVRGDWSGKVVYGKLGRTDAAAVSVNCNNGGGTADGVLLYAQVIFSATSNGPKLIGVVTPRVQQPDQPSSLVDAVFRRDEVVADEGFYGSADGTCCPSGRATTVWRYQDGKLRPIRTMITKRPFHY